MTVADDLATLREAADAWPTPNRYTDALDRVEAEIARLENLVYELRGNLRAAEEQIGDSEAEVESWKTTAHNCGARVRELEAEAARLRDGNADKVQRMSRLAGERDEARAEVARLERERDDARSSGRELAAERDAAVTRAARLRDGLREIADSTHDSRSVIRQRARALLAEGGMAHLTTEELRGQVRGGAMRSTSPAPGQDGAA